MYDSYYYKNYHVLQVLDALPCSVIDIQSILTCTLNLFMSIINPH